MKKTNQEAITLNANLVNICGGRKGIVTGIRTLQGFLGWQVKFYFLDLGGV